MKQDFIYHQICLGQNRLTLRIGVPACQSAELVCRTQEGAVYEAERRRCVNHPQPDGPGRLTDLEFVIPIRRESGLLLRLFICRRSDGRRLHGASGKFFPLHDGYHSAYYAQDGYLLYWDAARRGASRTGEGLAVYGRRRGLRLRSELRYMWELWRGAGCDRQARCGLRLRAYHYIFRPLLPKPYMLVSDRPNYAGDNGEVFFCYMRRKHPKEYRLRFVLLPASPDYRRLRRIGRVISPKSFCCRLAYLLGNTVIVSSQAEDTVFAPYGKMGACVRDLAAGNRFVFLQHGVTKDDQTVWLNAYRKNIGLFVTSTREEYASLLSQDYGYTKREVVLTGMPRYDWLSRGNTRRQVTLMFTWRYGLVEPPQKDGSRALREGFAESGYYRRLCGLIRSGALQRQLARYGYELHMVLHPCMEAARPYFSALEGVIVEERSAAYRDIFRRSALLITDYSSAVFDFVYLNKPVIYYQPDCEEFFDGTHMYRKGYFDYTRDGFGEVTKTPEELAAAAGRVLRANPSGCCLPPVYRRRVEQSFAYLDRHNCERVWQAIAANNPRGNTHTSSD